MISIIVYGSENGDNENTSTYSFDVNTASVRIGRAADNEIVLDNPQVSKYHAKIVIKENKLVIFDLDSTNGVKIINISNSRQVNRIRLKNGDSVEIGDYVIQVYYRFDDDDGGSTKKKKSIQISKNSNVNRLSVFISYSYKDARFRDHLEIHLKSLERQGLIEKWSDRQLMAGDWYSDSVNRNLETADIILLLVSAHFVASKYCYDVEMKRALELHQKSIVKVIPIIIRDCDWMHAPFASFEVLPKGGRPIDRWPTRDAGWSEVIKELRRISEETKKART